MNVSAEDIRSIKAGETKTFLCEDAKKLYSATSLVAWVKKTGMPKGVVNYETKKEFDNNIIIIRAMRDGDEPVLNR